jgi:hypothetical protein
VAGPLGQRFYGSRGVVGALPQAARGDAVTWGNTACPATVSEHGCDNGDPGSGRPGRVLPTPVPPDLTALNFPAPEGATAAMQASPTSRDFAQVPTIGTDR